MMESPFRPVSVNQKPVGTSKVPKIIWFYWDTGIENAPPVVSLSLYSWTALNPSWTVHTLDQATISRWISLDLMSPAWKQMPTQKQSNLIRKALLVKYGGVWVDATTVCLEPLNCWLDPAPNSGVLMWANQAPDRRICNWFIAAAQGDAFMKEWLESYLDFFSRPKRRPSRGMSRQVSFLHRVFRTATARARLWDSLFGKAIGIYPYFIDHYLAESLLRKRHSQAVSAGALMPQPGLLGVNRVPRGPDFGPRFLNNIRETRPPMLKMSIKPSKNLRVAQVIDGLEEIVESRCQQLFLKEN